MARSRAAALRFATVPTGPPEPESLNEKSRALVHAARAIAVSSLTRALEATPALTVDDADQWDFFATVAAIHGGLQSLYEWLGGHEAFGELLDEAVREAATWDAQAPAALEDCRTFVQHFVEGLRAAGHDHPQIVPDAIGVWVLNNVLQRQPDDDEIHAARPIGLLLVLPLAHWWDQSS